MARIADIVARMRRNPIDVRFSDLCKVCLHYFGEARQQSTSHRVYRTPWQGDPRVNIVLQVLKAIDRLGKEHGTDK